MSNPAEVRGRPFGPGNRFGQGRPKMPAEIRELKDQARVEVADAIFTSLLMDRDQLQSSTMNPNATMAQLLVASILTKAIKDGCPIRAQMLLNYVLGRPKTNDANDFEDDGPKRDPLETVPSGVIIELLRTHGSSGPVRPK